MVGVQGADYFEAIGSERSGFLLPSESAALVEAMAFRYRTAPSPMWPRPICETILTNLGRALDPFDLCMDPFGLYLNGPALDILDGFLTTGGELLPIETDTGETWQLFLMSPHGPFSPYAEITAKGVIRRTHADMGKPLPKAPRSGLMPWRRVQGRGDFVRWYEFDAASVAGRNVFRAQYEGKPQTGLFVSGAFVRAALDHGLRGLDYHVTARPDGPLWHADPHDKDFPFWY